MSVLLILASSRFLFAADPPSHPFGWRRDGSGQFPAATPVLEWSATKNVRWSTVVGKSYSSPILTKDSVLVTAEPNSIVCVARKDGAVQWKVEVKPADLADAAARASAADYEPPKDGSGMAAATPVSDGKSVYAIFANGIVCAVDLDGKRRWTTWIDPGPGLAYGRASSPLLAGGKLIVHLTNLLALDPDTGKQLWMNDHAKAAYGTPAVMTVGETPALITPAGDVIRLNDGASLNSGIAQATHTSPVVVGDAVYFVNGSISALRLDAKWKEKELWSASLPGDPLGSPIVQNDVLFCVMPTGELFSFDTTRTGEQMPIINARPLFGPPAAEGGPAAMVTFSSLTLAGNHLFLGSNKGDVVVLEATRDAKVVARNHLPSGSGASPVFSGGEIYLRDGDRIWCIGK